MALALLAMGLCSAGGAAAVTLEDGDLLVLEYPGYAIERIDPDTGVSTTLSSSSVGAGDPLVEAFAMALESPDSVLVNQWLPVVGAELYGIARVDPATGDRSWVAYPAFGGSCTAPATPYACCTGPDTHDGTLPCEELGSGPDFTYGKLVSEGPGSVIVTLPGLPAFGAGGSLVRIDTATGNRTLLSGPGLDDFPPGPPVGSGPVWYYPTDLERGPDGAIWVLASLDAPPATDLCASHCWEVYRVDPVTGDRTLVSGPSRGAGPGLGNARGLTVDLDGRVLVSEQVDEWPNESSRVLRIDPDTGDRADVFDTPYPGILSGIALAGDRSVIAAEPDLVRIDRSAYPPVVGPIGVALTSDVLVVHRYEPPQPGDLLVADEHLLLAIDPQTGASRTLASALVGSGAPVVDPQGVAVGLDGDIFFLDAGGLLRLARTTGVRSVVNGAVTGYALLRERDGGLLVLDNLAVRHVDPDTGADTLVSSHANFIGIDLAQELSGDVIVAEDDWLFGLQLTRIDRDTGVSAPIGGSGAPILEVGGLGVRGDGVILVAESYSNQLLRADPRTGNRSIVSDNNFLGSGPPMGLHRGMTVDVFGRALITYGQQVLRVDTTTGDRTLVAGPLVGAPADNAAPRGIAVFDGIADVAAGTSVTASTHGGASSPLGLEVEFDQTTGGVLSSQPAVGGPSQIEDILHGDPGGIQFILPMSGLHSWELDYTGSFTGPVTLTFSYLEPSSAQEEQDLEVYRYVPFFGGCSYLVDCGWVPLPVLARDLVANTITVQSPGFSEFALGGGVAPQSLNLNGVAQGGSIELTVGAVFLQIATTAGQTAAQVAAAIAAAIDAHPTLQGAGVTASANGGEVSTNGYFTSVAILDAGFQPPPQIPAAGPWSVALLLLALLGLGRGARRVRG